MVNHAYLDRRFMQKFWYALESTGHQYVFFMTLIFEYVSNYEKTVTTTNLPMIFLEVFLKKEEDFF